MLVFLDFEASSLAKRSFPIEVGWVFEDGTSAEHLIRPAPDWTDWDDKAAAIHGISRDDLAVATPHGEVARVMVEQLAAHDLAKLGRQMAERTPAGRRISAPYAAAARQ